MDGGTINAFSPADSARITGSSLLLSSCLINVRPASFAAWEKASFSKSLEWAYRKTVPLYSVIRCNTWYLSSSRSLNRVMKCSISFFLPGICICLNFFPLTIRFDDFQAVCGQRASSGSCSPSLRGLIRPAHRANCGIAANSSARSVCMGTIILGSTVSIRLAMVSG